MNIKKSISRTTALFIAMAVAGITIAAGANFIADVLEQIIMVGTGSAVLGAGLTFFLIRISTLTGE